MNLIQKVAKKLFLPGIQASYSQFGEDLIIAHHFKDIGIEAPTYFDIGANDPRGISNTYYFYSRGAQGVLVEPNPYRAAKLKSVRPRDVVIQAGIAFDGSTEADLFIFPKWADGMSTFSRAEADHWEKVGLKGIGKIPVERVVSARLVPVNQVIEENFRDAPPNLLSIDVEGLDLDVLKTLDFERHRPDVICVETVAYDNNQGGYKRNDIISFVTSQNYELHADTWANSIFRNVR